MSAESLEDALAWSLGRYTMHGEIASGGMATVHIGRLQGTAGFSKMVAIKRLHAQFAKDPDFVSMFLDEARLAARVHHPNVVQPLDVIATDGEVFLVMEYIPGESLSKIQKILRPRGLQVPVKITGAVMVGVLHGLHAAHEAKNEQGQPLGIVHRDVSPQNILVSTDGVARVLDFGIAKAADRAYQTQEGDLKGKLAYMAPEQLHGELDVDRRSDIYAASIVLWELLTGERLFDSDYQSAIMARAKAKVPKPPSQIVPDLSPELDRVVLKGLANDPKDRYLTAREMAIDLEMAMPLATPSKVGEWVEEVARESLERRSTRIKEIEQARKLQTASEHARAVLDELAIDEATRPTPSVKAAAAATRNFRPEDRERSLARDPDADEPTGSAMHVDIPPRLPPMRAPAKSAPAPRARAVPPAPGASDPGIAPAWSAAPAAPAPRGSDPAMSSPRPVVPAPPPQSSPRPSSHAVPAPPPPSSAPALDTTPPHMQRRISSAKAALAPGGKIPPPSIRSAPSTAHAPPASSRLIVEDLPSVIIAPAAREAAQRAEAAHAPAPPLSQSQSFGHAQALSHAQALNPSQSLRQSPLSQSQPLGYPQPSSRPGAPSQPYPFSQPSYDAIPEAQHAQPPYARQPSYDAIPEAHAHPSLSQSQQLPQASFAQQQLPQASFAQQQLTPQQVVQAQSFAQSGQLPSLAQLQQADGTFPTTAPALTQSQPYYGPGGAGHTGYAPQTPMTPHDTMPPRTVLAPPQVAAFELPFIPPPTPVGRGPGAIDLSGGKKSGSSFMSVLLFILIGLGGLYLALPAIVKHSYVSAAARRGIQLAVGEVDVSRSRIRLLHVTATATELPGVYLQASELDFGLHDMDPEMMVARDVDLTIDGPYATVRDALQRWLGAHPLRAGNFKGGLRRVQITRAHVVWGRAFGDTSKLDFDDVTGTIGRVEEHALGEDFKLDAGRVTVGTPIGLLGPWTLSVARSPVSLSAALGLTAPSSDAAGISYVDQDNGGITLDMKVPRATVDHIGVPKAALGAAIDEPPMQVEGTLKFSRPSPTKVLSEGAFAFHGLRLAGAAAPVEVAMQARLVGDPNTTLPIADGVLVFGSFKARIWGKATLSRDGVRVDGEWRSAPRSCAMVSQPDPTANIPQLAFDPTAVERSVAASPLPNQTVVGGLIVFDSRDVGQTKITARSSNGKCAAKIFP